MAKKKRTTKGKSLRHYSPDQIAKAIEAADGLLKPAAEALGCARSTLYLRIGSSPFLSKHLADVREGYLDKVESKLHDNIDAGKQQAIEYYLDAQGRKRGFGKGKSLEFDGDLPVEFTLKLGSRKSE